MGNIRRMASARAPYGSRTTIRARQPDGSVGQGLGHQDRSRSGLPELTGIPIGDRERERLGAGPVQRADPAQHDLPVAKQAAADQVGDRLRGETRSRHWLRCLTSTAE